jgi:hypothetical protein
LFVAAAVWAFFRVIQKERKERKKELTQLISSPALVSWTVFVVLLSVLWIISLGIDALGASTNAKPEAGLAWFLTQLTAVGVLSMATIQGIRSVLPIRGVFHRASLERWIDESIKRRSTAKPEDKGSAQTKEDEKSNEESAKKSPSDSTPNQQLMKRIVELSTVSTGDGYAFFDLPLEQLCGQIAAGADRLLDDPLGHMPGDMETKDHPDDRRAVKSLLSVLAGDPSDVDTFVSDAQIVGKDENATRDFLRTRANLSQRIQRNIDRLQIDTSFWWKRLVRGLAFTLCAVFGLAVFKNAIAAVICAVVAGFIAMVARDLVAIVEKARR